MFNSKRSFPSVNVLCGGRWRLGVREDFRIHETRALVTVICCIQNQSPVCPESLLWEEGADAEGRESPVTRCRTALVGA